METLFVISATFTMAMTTAVHAGPLSVEDRGEIAGYVDSLSPRINGIAHEIWRNPELGYKETKTSKLLSDELASHGFEVTTGVGGMPTAFVA
jgi:aminobenzoyl-glutamate utilization protein B